MRLRYAKADPPTPLRVGPLILHELWQEQLQQKYPNRRSWKPVELLEQALGLDHNNPNRSERTGVPLWNGTTHCINAMERVSSRELNVAGMRKLFLNNIPAVGVIVIRTDYPNSAQRPYLGLDEEGKMAEKIIDNNGKAYTHAVVLVGEYKASNGDPYGLKPGIYWIYQNSPTKNIPGVQSLLPNGMNILHPDLVVEAYYGVSFAPNALAPQSDAWRISSQQSRVKKRRQMEWEEIEELKRQQQQQPKRRTPRT
ncbi:hypothetical protein OROMI_005211 [Orobanche minor]